MWRLESTHLAFKNQLRENRRTTSTQVLFFHASTSFNPSVSLYSFIFIMRPRKAFRIADRASKHRSLRESANPAAFRASPGKIAIRNPSARFRQQRDHRVCRRHRNSARRGPSTDDVMRFMSSSMVALLQLHEKNIRARLPKRLHAQNTLVIETVPRG